MKLYKSNTALCKPKLSRKPLHLRLMLKAVITSLLLFVAECRPVCCRLQKWLRARAEWKRGRAGGGQDRMGALKRENGSPVTHGRKGNDVTSRPAHATTCKRVLFRRLPSDGDKGLSHTDRLQNIYRGWMNCCRWSLAFLQLGGSRFLYFLCRRAHLFGFFTDCSDVFTLFRFKTAVSRSFLLSVCSHFKYSGWLLGKNPSRKSTFGNPLFASLMLPVCEQQKHFFYFFISDLWHLNLLIYLLLFSLIHTLPFKSFGSVGFELLFLFSKNTLRWHL